MGMLQSLLCILPAGIAGVRVSKNEALPLGSALCQAYPFIYRYTEVGVEFVADYRMSRASQVPQSKVGL